MGIGFGKGCEMELIDLDDREGLPWLDCDMECEV